MLLQKDKKTNSHHNAKTFSNIKPYSIMSLGFINHSKPNASNRTRQTFHHNTHSKSSGVLARNQNQGIQMPKKTNQNAFCKEAIISQSTNIISLPTFDEGIIQESSIFRLQNITNRVGISSCQKMADCSNLLFWEDNEEDNHQNRQIRVFVDMKKKIRKLSKGKKEHTKMNHTSQIPQPYAQRQLNPFPMNSRIYADSEVIVQGSIFRNKLISQRIDNDIDTDDQQIASGIRRLHRSLTEAVEEQRKGCEGNDIAY